MKPINDAADIDRLLKITIEYLTERGGQGAAMGHISRRVNKFWPTCPLTISRSNLRVWDKAGRLNLNALGRGGLIYLKDGSATEKEPTLKEKIAAERAPGFPSQPKRAEAPTDVRAAPLEEDFTDIEAVLNKDPATETAADPTSRARTQEAALMDKEIKMEALTLAERVWQNYTLACTVIRLNQKEYAADKEHREAKERQLLEKFYNKEDQMSGGKQPVEQWLIKDTDNECVIVKSDNWECGGDGLKFFIADEKVAYFMRWVSFRKLNT